MTHPALEDFYEKRKSSFAAAVVEITGEINVISNVRLAVAVVFALVLYLSFKHHPLFYSLPLLLLLFASLVRRHSELFARRQHLQNLKTIQVNELDSLQGDFSSNDSGSEFIDPHHPYTYDLDIFGEGSFFQYINRCSTRGGKQLLAARLSGEKSSAEEIKVRHQAIQELTSRIEFRHEVQALAMQIDEQPGDERQLLQWLAEPYFIFGKPPYRILLLLFPALTLSLVGAAFIIDGITSFALLAAALQWVFLGFHMKRINAFHQYISRKKNLLDKYARILFFINKEECGSDLMLRLRKRAQHADERLRDLASLVGAFDARLNLMTNFIVNSLLLYDLQLVYRLEKWKKENASDIGAWLSVVRETEALCSVATFSFNHPQFVFPEISDQGQLWASGLGHPLIPERERVVNDVHGGQSIMIITGANMAGKSTFLRSLGVNVVLALMGAPVCAAEFRCPLIALRSGMRTADSLKENQSYFYAELRRLKSIMDELRSGEYLLILLDEILKGTNSTDKQAGSVALVKQLVTHSCLVFIATHDLALGDLEETYPDKVANYCFEADIKENQLSFDYKLKRGRAQNMNATFLMKQMGILDLNASDH